MPRKKMQTIASNDVYVLTKKNDDAELTLWGDIYETQPMDLDWTTGEGKPIEGDFILLDQFMKDLDSIKGSKTLTIHLNSYGGDAGVSNTIHNKLRDLSDSGTALTCIVDGVAMSGGSLIMCACDTVKAHPASLIMIHKAWSLLLGAYNADEMRAQAKVNDAWDKAQIEIYKRKTGLSDTVLDHMMAATTYMTGVEAKDKGFVNELLDGAEMPSIAASANRDCLYVGGHTMHIPRGVRLPDSIPTQAEPQPKTEAQSQKEEKPMTLDELREQYPDLIKEAENIGSATAASQVKAEQDRIAAIDEIADLFDADLVKAAKYGEHPMTAQELTYQAAVRAKQAGRKFMNDLTADSAESKANEVKSAASQPDAMAEAQASREAIKADAIAAAKAYTASKEAKNNG